VPLRGVSDPQVVGSDRGARGVYQLAGGVGESVAAQLGDDVVDDEPAGGDGDELGAAERGGVGVDQFTEHGAQGDVMRHGAVVSGAHVCDVLR
jgi:hypothetical protein